MTNYLISFPSNAMDYLTAEEFPDVVRESHEVVREAKAAGVWVFGGGIDEEVAPVMIASDGTPTDTAQPRAFDGGFTVIDVPTRAEAEFWAGRIATGCRCPQELRVFMDDPES